MMTIESQLQHKQICVASFKVLRFLLLRNPTIMHISVVLIRNRKIPFVQQFYLLLKVTEFIDHITLCHTGYIRGCSNQILVITRDVEYLISVRLLEVEYLISVRIWNVAIEYLILVILWDLENLISVRLWDVAIEYLVLIILWDVENLISVRLWDVKYLISEILWDVEQLISGMKNT